MVMRHVRHATPGYKYETDADFRKEGSRLKKALEGEIA